MKTTAKTTALALVLAMMVSIFCASISVSAEGQNLIAGRHDYTYYVIDEEGNEVENTEDDKGYFWKGCRDDDHTLLTDGKVREPFQLTAGGAPVKKITLELAGTTKTFYIDFSLGGACTVSSVVLDGVRRGNNRFCNIFKIEAKVGGAWQDVAFNEVETAIPDAQQYADVDHGVEPADQFFTVEEVFATPVANATNIKIAFDTNPGDRASKYAMAPGQPGGRAFLVQIDEVAVMGTRGGAAPPTPPPPTTSQDEGPAPAASGDTPPIADTSAAPVEPPTVPTGDAGIAVFAVLAVISGAAAFILRKKF